MVSIFVRVLAVLVAGAVVIVGRGYAYHTGSYQPPSIIVPTYTQIVAPLEPSTDYIDSFKVSEGTVIIDQAHGNAFEMSELNVLILRLVSRGLDVEILEPDDDLADMLLGEQNDIDLDYPLDDTPEEPPDETAEETAGGTGDGTKSQDEEVASEPTQLPKALIIICPQQRYEQDEINNIAEFVAGDGKVLLIDDPTRRGQMNSLSRSFGLMFESDYLYNMKENDANYRHIFITRFEKTEITRSLQKVALYTAGSISSNSLGIAFGDEDTFSSRIETRRQLSPLALVEASKVLAVYDLTFLGEPYNGIADNNQLISNIADWLATPSDE